MTEKRFAFRATIPILMGYLAIGIAFGLIIQNIGYPWYIALVTGVLIYAGSAQYALTGMFAAGEAYLDIALAVFLINSRHMVYGLSVLNKYKGCMPYTPYLVFGLTDETFGLITTAKIPETLDRGKTYFYITLFDQGYWVTGSLMGFFLGTLIPFDFDGVEFALTALFTVLLVEQWRNTPQKIPFVVAGICAVATLIIAGPENMLIISFMLAITVIFALKRWIQPC